MSAFYGLIEGNRGAATRGGSKNSGFRASAQSYDGSVITRLFYNDEGKLMVRVGTNDGSSCGTDWNSNDFFGTFEEFKKLLTLAHEIKNGEARVVHKRKFKNR